jgi:membrane-bound lytic murein transglycosylase F
MQRALIVAAIFAAACQRGAEPRKSPSHSEITNTAPVPKPAESRARTPHNEPISRDLDAIRASGELKVLFTFNSTGYFVYRGETMGYEYELLNLFAHESKLQLKPIIVRNSKILFDKLNVGEGDVVAAQLAATTNQTEVAMTNTLYEMAPVIVQRNPQSPTGATPAVSTALAREKRETAPSRIQVRARLISTPNELAGQKVHVPQTSPFRGRLLELNEELSQDIDVVEVDESSDKLIQRLAEGEIAFTVAADNLAQLKRGEYTNLIVKPTIGPPQPIVWGLRRNAPQLLAALNSWIEAKRKAGLLAALYRKYFLDRRAFLTRSTSKFLTAETGTLSPYDAWFQEYAKFPGWDWRLIAAQAYQESRFNPAARSWAGAIGLMQIMPRTAQQLHVNPNDPRRSVEAACRYLWNLDAVWKKTIPDESVRMKFILASYNVGLGHVQDAVRLAEKNGDNPGSWKDVAYWLIRKSNRSVFNDPVVKHGFARGTEPVAYVDEIMARWENYKAFVTETQVSSFSQCRPETSSKS